MPIRRASGGGRSGLFGGWLVIYLAVPFIGLLVYVAYHGVGSAPGVAAASYISAVTASFTTLILVVFGIPLASYLAHTDSLFSKLVRSVIRLPLGIPPLVSGIMLLIAFGPYSAIGRIFGGKLVSSMAAIVLAQLFVEMPFVIEGVRSGFSALSPEIFEVSHLLSVPSWRRIVGIELPLSIRTARTAIMMGWLRAFGEFGATVLVAYHPTSLPVLIFTQFSGTGLTSAILPVAAVLAISFVAVTLISRISTPSKLVLGIKRSRELLGRARPAVGIAATGQESQTIEFEVRGRAGGFSLSVDVAVRGRSLSITGPSGAGKSMTLRSIAGLLPLFLKRLKVGDLEAPKIAYVPQGQGLFDHLDVYSQLALAARWAGEIKDAREVEVRIAAIAGQVGIEPLLGRRVATLSGGQRQRVALARAIVAGSDLLILDEPFSALDRFERDRQIRFVRSLMLELNLFVIVVTHDITEAAYLSDALAIIDKGTVIAQGRVGDLLKNPTSIEVAKILGYENILPVIQDFPGKVGLWDASVQNKAPSASVVFRSSGHNVLSWVLRSDLTETSVSFEVAGGSVKLVGTCLVEDVIDLGTFRAVVLSSGLGPPIELDVVDTSVEIIKGQYAVFAVALDLLSTSIIENAAPEPGLLEQPLFSHGRSD